MLSEWVLERVASFLGGLFAVGLTESGRARAATRRRFLSGFRVISGRQPGLSREWLIGEWGFRRGWGSLDDVTFEVIEIIPASRRAATSDESLSGNDTVIMTVRTASAELEWSTLRRFDGLARRALDVEESRTPPAAGADRRDS